MLSDKQLVERVFSDHEIDSVKDHEIDSVKDFIVVQKQTLYANYCWEVVDYDTPDHKLKLIEWIANNLDSYDDKPEKLRINWPSAWDELIHCLATKDTAALVQMGKELG